MRSATYFPLLAVPDADGVQGPLNLLKADLKQHLADPDQFQRALRAVDVLRDVVALRRGQAHAGAAAAAVRAAGRLGIQWTGDWPASWNQVKRVTIEAIYALIEELDAA
jgi:hypothetical protein